MPFWFTLLLFAASTILGQLFRPKTSQPKPATLAEIEFPTAEETRSVAKGYGTFLMKAPNVVSVTDFSTEVIKSKVSTLQTILSFGAAKKQTIGYKYFIGMEMALGYRIDALTKIIIADKEAWTGEVTTDSEIYINKPNLFGGDDTASGGNGGVVGYLGVHVGLFNAAKDPYLLSEYGNYSAHRGMSYVVWKGQKRAKGSGYLGNSDRIEAWQFVARFIPNNLPYTGTNYSNINNGDANPSEVLYDIFRSAEYAIGMPQQYVDLPSFLYAAQQFHSEGLGFSALWDTSKPCRDIINQILQLTDSVIYSDLQTGKIVIKAARTDYDPNTIPHYTDKEILSISSYTRGAWAETTNKVSVPFINRLDNFLQQDALAFDTANMKIQQATVAANIQHIGISNPQTAANVAQRDMKAMTTPLAKVTFQVNLKGYKTSIGSTFKFSTKRIKDHNGKVISGMIMRCTGIKIGTPKNPIIEIEAVEDIFNSTAAIYAAPPASGGGNPNSIPVATSTYVLDELPLMLAGDEAAHLWCMAKAPNTSSYTYDLFSSLDNVTYEADDPNNAYTPTGLLNAAYSAVTLAVDTSQTFVVTGATSTGLDRLGTATPTEVSNGKNLMLVVEDSKAEIMAYESFSVVGGNYQFNNVWRGLLDTTPQSFTAAARVWFFSEGDARGDFSFTAGQSPYAKILTRTVNGILDLSAAAAIQKTVSVRSLRPYAPGNIRINNVYNGAVPVSGDVTLAWSHRDRTRQGTVLAQNAGTVGLEGGAKYILKIYNENGTLLRTVTDLVTESYVYTNAQETADNGGVLAGALTFQLYTIRDGITSYQAQQRGGTRGAAVPFAPIYAAGGAYTAPPAGNATSIGGVPITGTPSGTNNTPVYNPTTGVITWQAGASTLTFREVDGTPTGTPSIIEFPNGTVTDMGGGVFRITPAAGTPGSVWYSAAGAPANGLGVISDLYLNSANGDYYQKTGAAVWTLQGNLKGVQGNQGNTGAAGATWLTGAGVPDNALGANNDFYLNSTSSDWYKKIGGAWALQGSFKGIKGDTGNTGATGANGQALPRVTVSINIGGILAGATVTGTVNIAKSFAIMHVLASHLSRFRLYQTVAKRTADLALNRPSTTPPAKNTPHGVVLDLNMDILAYLNFPLSPEVYGANMENPPTVAIPYAIENLTGADITDYILTITYTVEEE